MERSPAESPPDPPATAPDRPRTRAGRSAPAWLWILTLGGFALIFWRFLPDAPKPVPYSPWFLDQVEAGTIKSVAIQGTEIRGLLRRSPAGPGGTTALPTGGRFLTYFPSEASIEPVVRRLREGNVADPVLIETVPPQEGGMLRLVLLIQAAALLIVALMLTSLRSRRP